VPIPVAAPSKTWVCGRSLPGVAASIPTKGIDVCFECCVLSGRGQIDWPIHCPEESYRLCFEYDQVQHLSSTAAICK